ncbi:MAG: MBG domain-containing protein [Capnocytophaga sp.]|nr:MBG domain-containing protein [Capnocytophaga sp.]
MKHQPTSTMDLSTTLHRKKQTSTLHTIFLVLLFFSTLSLYAQDDHEHTENCVVKTPTPEMLARFQAKQSTARPVPPTAKPADGNFTIDILFLYDETAQEYCQRNNITLEEFSEKQVQKMNEVLKNSELTDFTFKVASIEKIPSRYGSMGASIALDYLTDLSRPEFSKVAMRRELSGGDIVVMFIDAGTSGVNGAAWSLQGTPSNHKHMAMAVCGVRPSDTGYTAVHEVGHVLGCGHSTTQRLNPGHGARHNYSYGYQGKTTKGSIFSTVMAYQGGRENAYYPRIPYFSSPLVKHPDDPETFTGTNAADNVRTIRQYARMTSQNYEVTDKLKVSAEFIAAAMETKEYEIAVATNGEWTAESGAGWVTFNKNKFPSGDILTVKVTENPNPSVERETEITLKSTASGDVKKVKIRQALSLIKVLDNEELTWTTDGSTDWFGQSETSSPNGNGNSARSGIFSENSDGRTSYLRTKVVGPGKITFDYKVESKGGEFNGALGLMVNDDFVRYASGEQYVWSVPKDATSTGWKTESYEVSEGEYELVWRFHHGGDINSRAYMDNVRWEYDRDKLILGHTSQEIDDKEQNVSVKFRNGNEWTASVDVPWATLDRDRGQGSAVINLLATTNGTRHIRKATVTISNGVDTKTFVLTQHPDLLRAGMNADNLNWYPQRIDLYDGDLNRTGKTVQPWFGQREELYDGHPTAVLDRGLIPMTHYNNPVRVSTEVIGPGTFQFKYKSMTGNSDTFHVEVAGEKHTINPSDNWTENQLINVPEGKQTVSFAYQIRNAGTGKIYVTDVVWKSPVQGIFVEPTYMEVPSTSSERTVRITTQSAWQSELSVPWLGVSNPAGELGGDLVISIEKNTTGEKREGHVTLKTRDSYEKIKIVQNADEAADMQADINRVLKLPDSDPIFFGNDPDKPWIAQGWNINGSLITHNPNGLMQTPVLAKNETSGITAELEGKGKLTFTIHAELYIENAVVLYLDGKKIRTFHSHADRNNQQVDNDYVKLYTSDRRITLEILTEGKHIVEWKYEKKEDRVTFANLNGRIGDFLRLESVKFEAEVKTYAVTVKNGSGSGRYKAGAQVTLQADTPEEGWIFEKWSGADAGLIANATTANATFTMPAKEIALVAIYKNVVPNKRNLSGITFEDKTFAYDGTPKSLKIKGVLPDGVTVSYQNNNQTATGTYTVKAKINGGTEYNDLELEAELKIIPDTVQPKTDLNITFEGKTFVYDGSTKSVLATNIPKGIVISYENNDKINVGTYPVTATFAGNEMYNTWTKTVSLVITKATISGAVFENKTFVYDGTPKSLSVENLPQGVTVSYQNNGKTEAGTHEVTATLSGQNYNELVLKATVTITKATISDVIFENKTFVYDGTPKSLSVENLPQGVTVSYQNNGKTEAGTHEVTATLSGQNYNELVLKATLTIQPKEEPETPADEKFNYYPNPIVDVLNIVSDKDDVAYIYDSSGRLLMQFSVKKGTSSISLGHLPKGVYLLVTQNGQKVKLQR